MNQVGIVIALERELIPLVNAIEAEAVEVAGCLVYQVRRNQTHFLISQSGVGRANAAASTAWLIQQGCSEIINFGTCGSLYPDDLTGRLLQPTVFIDGDFDLTNFGVITRDPAGCNNPQSDEASMLLLTESRFTETLNHGFPCLIDMEAYDIVAICKRLQIPASIYKVVSNSGATNAVSDYKKSADYMLQGAVDQFVHDAIDCRSL